MEDKEKNILKSLERYEKEEKESMLTGQMWDEVEWNIYYLSHDYNYSDEKLKELFPHLCWNM